MLGLSIALFAMKWLLKRYIRNKLALRKLISEMYHKDLLPEICQMEGLAVLYQLEDPDPTSQKSQYIAMALDKIRKHKAKVMDVIKKYEPFQ